MIQIVLPPSFGPCRVTFDNSTGSGFWEYTAVNESDGVTYAGRCIYVPPSSRP